MIALLQRVRHARVEVGEECVGAIGHGLLVFAGVQPGDGEAQARRMAERILNYRLFADAEGRMNRSVRDVAGGVLLVSQFTLAADTGSGLRPSFSAAAPPPLAESVFALLYSILRDAHPTVQSGRFGANMQVSLVNDGPVTFILEVR